MKALFLVILTTLPLFAQSGPIFENSVPRRLVQFLNLTEGQTAQIAGQMTQYQSLLADVLERMDKLYEEVVAETARPQPRAAELGMRYVEIELTCRRGLEEYKRLRERNLSVLTAAQKERLKVLSDALTLLPEIGQAQYVRLLDEVPYVGLIEEAPQIEGTGGCSVRPVYGTIPSDSRTPGTIMLPRMVRQSR